MNLIRQTGEVVHTNEQIHILGCGAVGSHIAIMLTKMGFNHFILWDFDDVEDLNIPNQAFTTNCISSPKSEALELLMKQHNPEVSVETNEKWEEDQIHGYAFVAFDNIETRKAFYEANKYNVFLKATFDVRLGLDIGQVFSAEWKIPEDVDKVIEASNFPKSESETPTSICGTKIQLLPTVIIGCACAVSNFTQFIKEGELTREIHYDSFSYHMKGR